MTTRTRILLLACGLSIAGSALAQYKYVGPDGRVTYSDLPPPPTARSVTQKKLDDNAATNTGLPFDVQQAVSKFPVVLYTGNGCAPCEDARGYLRGRGIPFVEKTVTSDEDIALFKQQSPDGTAPVVTVGSRKTVGFAQATLSSLLDSAGYPATAALPRDYQNPVPTPLSPNTRAPAQDVTRPAPRTAAASANPPSATPAPQPAPNTPPGFRF